MNDLAEKLWNMAEDWRKLSDPENEAVAKETADHIEAQSKLIEEMREALQSASEELYQISHPSGDPDDESNMDSYAAAYRECRSALSKSNPNTPERNDE